MRPRSKEMLTGSPTMIPRSKLDDTRRMKILGPKDHKEGKITWSPTIIPRKTQEVVKNKAKNGIIPGHQGQTSCGRRATRRREGEDKLSPSVSNLE